MPAEKCTKIFQLPLPGPPPLAPFLDDEKEEVFAISESMISQAASAIFEMDDED